MLQAIINYFRDCYIADQRDLTLWSIFDKKVQDLHVMTGEEQLLNGKLPKQYIPDEIAQQWRSTLQIYSKEKQLYYFSFVIAGNTGVDLVGRKQICAPLIYYPAELEQDGDEFYISINFAKRQLNYPLISLLTTSSQEGTEYLERIFSNFPSDIITFEHCGDIQRAISPYLEQLDWEELFLYPQLSDTAKLKSHQRKQKLHILPAGAIGVVESSKQTRGVLNELRSLSTGEQDHSASLKQLFEQNQPTPSLPTEDTRYVPVVLSQAQQDALDNVQKHRLSMIVGPPGTGKSYTIAAMAIDCFSKGQTVLVASKMDHAVNVIADKIEQQLNMSGMVVRAGSKNYLSQLKKDIKLILTGNRRKGRGAKLQEHFSDLKTQINRLDTSANEMTERFEKRVQSEIEWADYLYKKEPSWFVERWFKDYKSKKIKDKIQASSRMWDILHSVEAYTEQRHKAISEYLQIVNQYNIWQNVYAKDNRQHLHQFLKGLKARTGSKQANLFEQTNFDIILHAFPIWLVNLADLYDVLPMQKELFDVAIIDEATQCDIATCLPLFQRAKHVVVVGDPHQLRHVSFLSKARERILIQENGLEESQVDWLDYREKSILDLVDEQIKVQDAVTFLDEHFRSLPDIISYSNRAFYNDGLHVMSQNPINIRKQAVELVQCDGQRSAKGFNEKEADFIFEKIKEVLENEALLDASVCHKIGILSPFRDQVVYLQKRLATDIAPELILKHTIQVGTAHSFQGEERDIMFISFAVDGDSHSGSFVHINKADVFNVSITRARVKQYVLFSAPIEKLKATSHLHQYLTRIRQTQLINQEQKQNKVYDKFLKQVMDALTEQGIVCHPNYPIAGLEVDLVAEFNQQILGIDLIGWSETLGNAFSLERYQILNRAGLKIIPLPYTLWAENKKECMDVMLEEFMVEA